MRQFPLESLIEQLDYSIEQLSNAYDKSVIFDRAPIDYVAYAMYIAHQDSFDINDSEISERFIQIKEVLTNLDLIIPITKEYFIEYTEENPYHRKAVDKYLKEIYREDK